MPSRHQRTNWSITPCIYASHVFIPLSLSLSRRCWISHFKASWWQQLWNREKTLTDSNMHTFAPTHMISVSGSRFLTSVPSILGERNNLQNGVCAFWQMPECYFFIFFFSPLSHSAEIRGFKVLSYISMKELPICSQVIRGKQSCVPRLDHAKLCYSHGAPGSPVIHVIWKHRVRRAGRLCSLWFVF